MTKPTFVYDNIFLTKDDYEFFQSLPNREKLLFLYDLCLEVEEFEEDFEDEYLETEHDPEKGLISNKLLKVLEQSSHDIAYVHILMLPDALVISGNLQSTINSTKNYLFSDGYIFTKSLDHEHLLKDEVLKLKTCFKFVEVYKLFSIIYPTSLN